MIVLHPLSKDSPRKYGNGGRRQIIAHFALFSSIDWIHQCDQEAYYPILTSKCMHQQSNYAIGNPLNKMLSANTFLDLSTQQNISRSMFFFWIRRDLKEWQSVSFPLAASFFKPINFHLLASGLFQGCLWSVSGLRSWSSLNLLHHTVRA